MKSSILFTSGFVIFVFTLTPAFAQSNSVCVVNETDTQQKFFIIWPKNKNLSVEKFLAPNKMMRYQFNSSQQYSAKIKFSSHGDRKRAGKTYDFPGVLMNNKCRNNNSLAIGNNGMYKGMKDPTILRIKGSITTIPDGPSMPRGVNQGRGW